MHICVCIWYNMAFKSRFIWLCSQKGLPFHERKKGFRFDERIHATQLRLTESRIIRKPCKDATVQVLSVVINSSLENGREDCSCLPNERKCSRWFCLVPSFSSNSSSIPWLDIASQVEEEDCTRKAREVQEVTGDSYVEPSSLSSRRDDWSCSLSHSSHPHLPSLCVSWSSGFISFFFRRIKDEENLGSLFFDLLQVSREVALRPPWILRIVTQLLSLSNLCTPSHTESHVFTPCNCVSCISQEKKGCLLWFIYCHHKTKGRFPDSLVSYGLNPTFLVFSFVLFTFGSQRICLAKNEI